MPSSLSPTVDVYSKVMLELPPKIKSLPTPTVRKVNTNDGMSWHVKQTGMGRDLILIPACEGDSSTYDHLGDLLSSSFRITTFDMPGFSRTIAPPFSMEDLTVQILATQVVTLMDELAIPTATFFSVSTGSLVAMGLLTYYPDRVERIIIHEAPLHVPEGFRLLKLKDDAYVMHQCREMFPALLMESRTAWEAMGAEYHARMEKNYVTWLRKYIGQLECHHWDEGLLQRPVHWSVGSLNVMGGFYDNIILATKLGLEVEILPCKHYPQLTIPKVLAAHIRCCVKDGA
ncbi:uncharacterized protein L3040_005321 [Drepanopeziza brunnea f. sp. 'multigermtubi']|uniref:uncharacterized protein n=1 Tax=Drepanopeziza brunnea f. sp. 'multigermtubi' TaxID=698441 RepID=UPI0023A6EDEF|nr:hypothetical protein L3040_005321 [Drepanopeziza brunnea f. sp. 'multigermtubi']